MRWKSQQAGAIDPDALAGLDSLGGLEALGGLVRSVTTPDFAGVTFHEVLAKSALNRVPGRSAMPFDWTINPYRGCTHACVYCFARRTHEYLDFDAGSDFDQQIIVKTNVSEVLRREVAKPSWQRETVALGTNTDPYQRAEGRYRLMPGIIDALAASGTPMSILTKGTLVRRDLRQLADVSVSLRVDIAMSIAIPHEALRESLEPGAPSFRARVETVRAASDAGLRPTVFLMPILPHLTDDAGEIDEALAQLADAGARRVIFGALHLRPGAKEWFSTWLERERPDLVATYRGLYPAGAVEAPVAYRRVLASRVRPLLRKHGLSGGSEESSASRSVRPGPVVVTSRGRSPQPATLF